MCGILGYVGNGNASDFLIEGLRRLEYRGYDSAGIAVYENGKIEIEKKAGRLVNLEKALEMIERLPSQNRKAFNYEAQIAKLEEEIERYQKLKLRLYEDLSDGIIDKSEYFEFRNSYTKIIEGKQDALLRVKKEMKQTVTTGTTERNWVMLFKQYENVEELNRRVLMSLVDRILIHENHAIEIVFKYRDEYQQTLEYILGYADELDIAV